MIRSKLNARGGFARPAFPCKGENDSRDDAAFLLRSIRQAAWRYDLARGSARRAQDSPGLDRLADDAWRSLDALITEATNLYGVVSNGSETKHPAHGRNPGKNPS